MQGNQTSKLELMLPLTSMTTHKSQAGRFTPVPSNADRKERDAYFLGSLVRKLGTSATATDGWKVAEVEGASEAEALWENLNSPCRALKTTSPKII